MVAGLVVIVWTHETDEQVHLKAVYKYPTSPAPVDLLSPKDNKLYISNSKATGT